MNRNNQNDDKKKEEVLKSHLKNGLDKIETQLTPPDFRSLWEKALLNSQVQEQNSKFTFFLKIISGSLAAGFILFLVFLPFRERHKSQDQSYAQTTDLFVEFTKSTHWESPSDILLNDFSTVASK